MKSLTTFVKLNPGHQWERLGFTSPTTPPTTPRPSTAGTQAQPAQQREMPAGFGLQRFIHAVQRERRGDRRQLAQRELTPAQLATARTPSKD